MPPCLSESECPVRSASSESGYRSTLSSDSLVVASSRECPAGSDSSVESPSRQVPSVDVTELNVDQEIEVLFSMLSNAQNVSISRKIASHSTTGVVMPAPIRFSRRHRVKTFESSDIWMTDSHKSMGTPHYNASQIHK